MDEALTSNPPSNAPAADARKGAHAWIPSQFAQAADADGTARSRAASPSTAPSPLSAPSAGSSPDGSAAHSGLGSAASARFARGVRSGAKVREYSTGEEVANAVTHGVGAALAIAAIPIAVVTAVSHGGGAALAAALIYTISMFLEYMASTLYHALAPEAAKKVFKVLDHAAIYLFIAGSYTPFCLVTLASSGGYILCGAVWALAAAGIAAEAFWVFRPRWLAAALYLALGWCVVGWLPALLANLPAPGLWLLVAGGACYSVGCVFYVLKKVPYMHSVFHLWVLAGSVLQFLSVVLYVL